MESYCLKCRKHTKNVNPRVLGNSNGKAMKLSKCAICGKTFLKIENEKDY